MSELTQTALFALGNFWEPAYEFAKLPGVMQVEAGYTGGTTGNPTHHTAGDHTEALQITFDAHHISLEELLDKFWSLHDPTAEYEPRFASAIFYFDESQHRAAETSKATRQTHYTEQIVTEIVAASKFYPAEDYNQNYMARLRGEL